MTDTFDFDTMAHRFTARVADAANWKDDYRGAAYATRIKAAIASLKAAIAEAEQHPEIAPKPERIAAPAAPAPAKEWIGAQGTGQIPMTQTQYDRLYGKGCGND